MPANSDRVKLLLLAVALFGGFVLGVINWVVIPALKVQESYKEVSGGIRGQNYEAP